MVPSSVTIGHSKNNNLSGLVDTTSHSKTNVWTGPNVVALEQASGEKVACLEQSTAAEASIAPMTVESEDKAVEDLVTQVID